jgi:hypothetical protein
VSEWVVWVPITLLALAVAALGVAVLRDRSRRSEELAAAYAVIADLQERLSAVERGSAGSGDSGTLARPPSTTGDGDAVVITRIDQPEAATDARDHRIDGSLFADLVLRESLVKGVSVAYGVGRALSPETRNRIRFLMRQEVKRSRKQRRADLRAARRHLAHQPRADQPRADQPRADAPGEDAA